MKSCNNCQHWQAHDPSSQLGNCESLASANLRKVDHVNETLYSYGCAEFEQWDVPMTYEGEFE